MLNNIKNKNGGLIQLIIVIIVAILLINYFNITLADVWNWFKAQLQGIL